MVDTYDGRMPMASWRRPPGRPRNVWLNKVQEDAGIVECLKNIDVGCNPKQFDVEADRKCILYVSFSAVNENADENEIPFSAEKRKRKSPVPITELIVTVQLRT